MSSWHFVKSGISVIENCSPQNAVPVGVSAFVHAVRATRSFSSSTSSTRSRSFQLHPGFTFLLCS